MQRSRLTARNARTAEISPAAQAGTWIAPAPRASRCRFQSSDRRKLVPAASAFSSARGLRLSRRIEPGVGQAQPDHNSTDDDQDERDDCQLEPAKGRRPLHDRGPVDVVAEPPPCNDICDEANSEYRGNQIAELEEDGRYVGNFSDNVLEVDDRVLDVPLQLEDALRDHIAELLQSQVVHICETPAPLLQARADALARFLGGLSSVGLQSFGDIEIFVQPRDDGVVGERCSEKLYHLSAGRNAELPRHL